MPEPLYLPDGTTELIFKPNDFLTLILEKLGTDAARYYLAHYKLINRR